MRRTPYVFVHTHNIVNAVIRVELGLDLVEDDDRAVCPVTTEFSLPGQGGRKSNGIMESEAQRLVDLFAADILKEIVLQVLDDGEQRTALRVRGGVLATRTCYWAGSRSGGHCG